MRYRAWLISEETEFGVDYPKLPIKELEKKYDRNYNSLKMKAFSMGIKRDCYQSYLLRLYSKDGLLLKEVIVERSANSKSRYIKILKGWRRQFLHSIESGEIFISITHGLECYT